MEKKQQLNLVKNKLRTNDIENKINIRYRDEVIKNIKENCRVAENFEKYNDLVAAVDYYDSSLFMLKHLAFLHLEHIRSDQLIKKVEKKEIEIIDKSAPIYNTELKEIEEEQRLTMNIMLKMDKILNELEKQNINPLFGIS